MYKESLQLLRWCVLKSNEAQNPLTQRVPPGFSISMGKVSPTLYDDGVVIYNFHSPFQLREAVISEHIPAF